ncbi:MAG TPA: M81 family metallopeptidase [Roseiflexaceae bacterium]|nr:M81 family metallopeptidase [Roseiflexaceae bacterium]
MRIGIGSIVQETNSFSPVPGSRLHFPPGQVLRGDELLARREGTRTEVGGAIAAARERGARLVPLLAAMATASAGPMEAGLFRELLGELLERLRAAAPLDGLLLVLHGAMAAEGCEDATGEILRAARETIGPALPLVATLDLHANVTQRMAQEATALVGYHTAPHVDLYETGARGMALLARTVAGEARPVMALRRLPMILPAENGRTTDGPYAEVMGAAIAGMHRPGVLDASVFSVQPWLDVEDVGCSVLVVGDGEGAAAEALADELAALFWERRQRFAVELSPAVATIRAALASERGPWVLADSADAPSSGAPGDSTAVLELLLDARPERSCLHNIVDAPAVRAMAAAGVGGQVRLRVGGASGAPCSRPLDVAGRVRLLADGAFVNKGQGFQGVTFQRGLTGVLQIGAVALVVMERPVIQWDPELYRSVGLEPRDAQIVVVKSPAAFRAAYGPLAAEIRVLDAPGVCSPNLRALPWRRCRRPIYPLDEGTVYAGEGARRLPTTTRQ